MEIQKEHQICIHKKELTELDIYHRILRFKNYMVASYCLLAANMMNQCNKSVFGALFYRLPW